MYLDNDQISRQVAKTFAAAMSDQGVIFDAYTAGLSLRWKRKPVR
jgi:hypothetical protein